jgi:hypothetical protein
MMRLTLSGKALVVTMILQLLFGGYLAARDYFTYADAGSALTVLFIYGVLGVFSAMFLFGKWPGLAGVLSLSIILIIFHTIFTILSFGPVDAGAHAPLANWWTTLLRYPFFVLTFVFSIKVYRERRASLRIQPGK